MIFRNSSNSGKKANSRHMKARRKSAKESSLNRSSISEEGILKEAGRELDNRHLSRKVSCDSSAFTNFIQYKGCKGNNKASFLEQTSRCLRSATTDS